VGALVFLLVLGAIGAGIWLVFYRKAKRRQGLALFAQRNGLQFSPEDPFRLVNLDFHLFRRGDGRGCENVVYGRWHDLPIREADYWYYTTQTDSKGGSSRSYSYFSVAVADLSAFLPYVSIAKENLLTRLADHVGLADITFESEDFNKEFNVTSKDREFAFKLLDARMMTWLLSTRGRFGFEVEGTNLLVYGKRLKPSDVLAPIGTSKEFHDHVPRLVWAEYGNASNPDRTERSEA
jgi:hypothetical protein